MLAAGLCWGLCVSLTHAITLKDLPYRDPAPLDVLLALDESRFAATLGSHWATVERTILAYLPHGTGLTDVSVFADTTSLRCLRAHDAGACRLLMDLLAFEMKSHGAAPQAAGVPVLMAPSQLPWKDTALPRALLLLDAPQLQSALSSHWSWCKDVIGRFLPGHTTLHPVSKVFDGLRDTCQSAHTEVACRAHVQDIVGIVDANRGLAPAMIRTLAQIPYRDPAPLERLLALDDTTLRDVLDDWPAVDALLDQYIPAQVAIAGDLVFARARLDCQVWIPGDFFLCRRYIARLSRLMQGKSAMASPFAALR